MSDGPHRSLPMRRGWKKLAERADNCAFETEQVAEAIPEAIEGDLREEWSPALGDVLHRVIGDPEQTSLFKALPTEELEKARHLAAGKPILQLIVDCLEKVLAEGKSSEPLLDALATAMQNYVTRCFRSVEEHYVRKSSTHRAQRVRTRLEEASTRPSYRDHANRFLKSNSSGAAIRAPKRIGLDEGVRIP